MGMEQWLERLPRFDTGPESRGNLSGPKPYFEVKIQRIEKQVVALQ